MRGRKPISKKLHELHGHPGKGNATGSKKFEPIATTPLDDPPTTMSDDQQKIWRYAMEHCPLDVVRAIDKAALKLYCAAADAHDKASYKVATLGLFLKRGSVETINPYLAVMDRQAILLLKAITELGFSPVARARLRGSIPAPRATPDDPTMKNRDKSIADFSAHMNRRPIEEVDDENSTLN